MRIQQKPLTRHALGAFITAGSTLLGAWMVTLAFKAIAQARSEEPIDWGRHSGALADTFEQSLGQTILTRLDNTVGLLLLVLLVAVILSGLYQLGFLWLYRNKVGVYHSLGLFWMDFWLSPSVPFVSIFLLLLLGVQLDVIPVGFLTSYGVWVLVLALVPTLLLTRKALPELENAQRRLPSRDLLAHMGFYTAAEALRMAGLVLALMALAGPDTLPRLLGDAVFTENLSLAVSLAWALAVMVVVARLLGDLVLLGSRALLQTGSPQPPSPALDREVHDTAGTWAASALAVGLVLFGALGVTVLLSPFTAGYNPLEASLRDRMSPPSAAHLLGTDYIGRDILSRLVHAVRLELLLSLAVFGMVGVLSLPWGLLAAHFGRMSVRSTSSLGEVLLWPARALASFPWITLPALVGMLSESTTISILLLALALVFAPRLALGVQEINQRKGRLPAAHALARLSLGLLPLVTAGVVFVHLHLGFSALLHDPPRPQMGLMLLEMRDYLATFVPISILAPGITALLLVFSLLLISDSLFGGLGVPARKLWARTLE